jgi:outer membrane receptor for ferrienterochelin and colicins
VLISYLGFVTITDTFQVAQDKVYYTGPVSQEINDVVVTGQYSPNSSQKSVYEVKVISAEMIKSKGANNLREALQNELSIDLGQDQVFGSSLGINGISGEGIKIMVDGVPIVGRLDGKLDLSQININNIERIEIVEGPLSVMYGTDAMGGVINIITKSFQPEKVNVQLRAYYETVGQYNIDLSAGFSFRKSQVFLSGGRYFFDGFTTADSIPRFMEWKPKEQYFADAKYMYSGNKFRFSFTGAFF